MTLETLVAEPWADYALLDSGHGRKLERYGPFRFIRPEPQALWAPAAAEWQADGEFTGGSDEEGGGRWSLSPDVPDHWQLAWEGVPFRASCTPFRHLAFFPDMAPHWAWLQQRLKPGAEVLNLFGYTGVASLVAARAGANVTHVDASKKAIAAARDNQAVAGLSDRPIRWLVDDAMKFMAREVRRERRYDVILLDPPKFGRGPGKEVWRLYEDLPELLAHSARLLKPESLGLVATVYAIRMSSVALTEALRQATAPLGGTVTGGEMTIREEARGLTLPTAIFARWEGRSTPLRHAGPGSG